MKVQNPKLTSTITQQRNLRNGVTLRLTKNPYVILYDSYIWQTSDQTSYKYNKSQLDNIDQFDLAQVKNVNRSTDTWDLLEKLEQGEPLR